MVLNNLAGRKNMSFNLTYLREDFTYIQDIDGLKELVRRSLGTPEGPAMFLYTLQGIGPSDETQQ